MEGDPNPPLITQTRCSCGRLFTRPKSTCCVDPHSIHVQPDVAQEIVESIEFNSLSTSSIFSDFDFSTNAVKDQIRDQWAQLIRDVLAGKANKEIPLDVQSIDALEKKYKSEISDLWIQWGKKIQDRLAKQTEDRSHGEQA